MQQCREKGRASHAFASPLFSSGTVPCDRTACVTTAVVAEHSLITSLRSKPCTNTQINARIATVGHTVLAYKHRNV